MTSESIASAGSDASAPAKLGKVKAEAASVNARQTLRLANLQSASRNDLVNAFALFIVWGVLALLDVSG